MANNTDSSFSCNQLDNSDDDSVLCVSGSKIVRTCVSDYKVSDKVVKFVNAGGEDLQNEGDSSIHIVHDQAFKGGDTLRTNETILDCGSLSSLYQSARFGNFSYHFDGLPCGDYLLDLHFSEIINTNGPKGMRVFDVLAQDENVVSELDIYSYVGANRPLKLMDIRSTVGLDGMLVIKFNGVHGTPIVSGICIKEAPKVPAYELQQGCLEDHSYVTDTPNQFNNVRMKHISKYEKKIEELTARCQLKSNECYEAWMSLATNKTNLLFRVVQSMGLQEIKLKDAISMRDHEKKSFVRAINELGKNIEIMKQEQTKLSRDAHECVNLIPDMDKMLSAIQTQVTQFEDLKRKYNEELAKRKKLYNQVQEAKGNMRVFCRCRPPDKHEVSAGHTIVVDFSASKDGDLGIVTGSSTKKLYRFDRIYTPNDGQVDVFADASPMVISVLDGYNVCIFAYGQTGTGKTFTMEGTEKNRGVNYRTLEALFDTVEEMKDTFSFNISICVLEVYNEQIRDLLATSRTTKKLEVRQATEGARHVPGIVEAKVESIREVWNALQAGSNARAVGSNNVNEHSSRSHCMICVTVKSKNLLNGECTKSKLWLVDLAGSEKLAKTNAQGDRLKEAQNINRSLSALGDVISALASKNTHIPYRNSKLTHLLQDSLGGDSKTVMCVQISPSEHDMSETLSSLNFATRVRGVELGPAKKQIDPSELQKLKSSLDKAKQDLRLKDEAIKKLEGNYQSLEVKIKCKDQMHKSQQDQVDDVTGQLELKAQLCKQLEKQTSQLSDEVKEKQDMCSTLQKRVIELENKLKEKTQMFEHKLSISEDKIKKLEYMLERQDGQVDSQMLNQKIKESEEKPMLQVKQLDFSAQTQSFSSESHGSALVRGTESHRELRRKHDAHNRGGVENTFIPSSAISDPSVDEKRRGAHRVDPSKAFARVTRSAKSFAVTRNKINTEQAQRVKERDVSTRVWSR
nr:kinesin-like protein KIN-14R [Tanacetum cinerariifolium]